MGKLVLILVMLGLGLAREAAAERVKRCTDCGPQNAKVREVCFACGPTAMKRPKKAKLTSDEWETLQRGEIGQDAHVIGVTMAATIGLGSGQGVQGRWRSTGWIYFTAEAVTLTGLVFTGFGREVCSEVDGDDCGRSYRGALLLFLAVRGLSVLDTLIAPAVHNSEVRQLRAKTKGRVPVLVMPFAAPTERGDGATAGISVSF